MRRANFAHLTRLLVRHIGDDDAVHARRLEILNETGEAVVQHIVDIAHAHERHLGETANRLHDFAHFRERHAALQSGDGSRLDDGTVRHRVGKRQPEFYDIGACLFCTAHRIDRAFRIGHARRQIDDEPFPALFFQTVQYMIQTRAHSLSLPNAFATICTSLSPRPERQTTTTSCSFVPGISFSRYASAWELSMAGTMPSRRQSR